MSQSTQTSAHNADRILDGVYAFLNQFNKNRNEDSKIKFVNLIEEFNQYSFKEKRKIANALWLSGKASAITNSPYNAGMSETIFKNRSNERRYFNKLNNCLKIAVLADLDNNIIDMNNEIAQKVTETLIMLDTLSISSQKRQKLFDEFENSFVSINPDNEVLLQLFKKGLSNYNEYTLKATLAKFSIPHNNLESNLNNHDSDLSI